MHDDYERVDVTSPKLGTRMTGVWVFLGGVALWLIVPLFRPRPGVLQCSDGPGGGECVERYIEPAILPPALGLFLLTAALPVIIGVFVRKWRNR